MILSFSNTPLLCQQFLEAQGICNISPFRVSSRNGTVTTKFYDGVQYKRKLDNLVKRLVDNKAETDFVTLND